ncbi:MAG: hypothetical protein ACTSYI_16550 [Promethearchaeota archaeon]
MQDGRILAKESSSTPKPTLEPAPTSTPKVSKIPYPLNIKESDTFEGRKEVETGN